MTRFTTNTYRNRPRVAPRDAPAAVGVFRGEGGMPAGIAYPCGHVGGLAHDFDSWPIRTEWLGPPETTWRLVVGKDELEGRFVLRLGVFVELGEDAR